MPSDAHHSHGSGPGSKPVGSWAILWILVVLLAASGGVIWTLARLLRQPTSSAQVASQDSATVAGAVTRTGDSAAAESAAARDTTRRGPDSLPVSLVQRPAPQATAPAKEQRVTPPAALDSAVAASRAAVDARLFLIVLLSGALGGLLHAVRSFVWYVGNRELRWSWIPTYITLPVTSALLAATMYFVVRAGFLGFQGSGDLNAYGFAGASALIGLFSQSAILKLKEVAETLFTRPPQGADARPEVASNAPAASSAADDKSGSALAGDSAEGIAPVPVTISATLRAEGGKPVLTIEGSGFRKHSQVVVNATKVPTTSATPKKITAVLPDALASVATLKVQVSTPPPGGGESAIVLVVPEAQAGDRSV